MHKFRKKFPKTLEVFKAGSKTEMIMTEVKQPRKKSTVMKLFEEQIQFKIKRIFCCAGANSHLASAERENNFSDRNGAKHFRAIRKGVFTLSNIICTGLTGYSQIMRMRTRFLD